MRMRVEPKDFFMYTVFLAFKQEHPDREDEAVKAYLAEHELIAKGQGKNTLEDQEYDVMYFGGCYLGKHLKVIGDMQRDAVEQDMLATEIERILQESTAPATRNAADQTQGLQRKEVIANLVQEFHQESSFGSDEEGYLKVTLEPAVIQRKFVELAGERV